MQINWESITGLRGTRSDIWILIPTAVIVNRLLDKEGNTMPVYQKVLDPIDKIAKVYCSNLGQLWKYVSKPLRLNNRNGAPLFHFVFASNNATALKIAKYIIEKP